MRILMLLFVSALCGCDASEVNMTATPDAALPCTALFGLPSENTGLSPSECGPSCLCGTSPFNPPAYTSDDVENLERFELIASPDELVEDPYSALEVDATVAAGAVCGVIFEDEIRYRLQTFPGVDAAAMADAKVTHHGSCGLCSSLANLAVYMGQPDLTDPVRQCGLTGIGGGMEANVECLEAIGFDRPCAQIWYYNTNHTRENCFELCIAHLNQPHHLEDGSLNPCIACDERQSGPVFKAVAGRTRRNSGLPSGLCRPCDSVAPVVHDYP